MKTRKDIKPLKCDINIKVNKSFNKFNDSSCGNINEWQIDKEKLLFSISEEPNQILAIDYKNDGNFFASGGTDSKIRIYDCQKKILVTTYQKNYESLGHSNRIFSLKFLPDSPQVLISGGWDTQLFFWDLRQQNSIDTISGIKISGDTIDYSPNEQQIIIGNYRTKSQLESYDFRKKGLIWSNSNYKQQGILSLRVTKNQQVITSGNFVNGYSLLTNGEMQNSFVIKNFEKPAFTCDYNHLDNEFAFAGNDGRIRLFSIDYKL